MQKCSLNPFQVFSSATITYRWRCRLSNFYLDYQKNGDDAENDLKNATGCAENDSKKNTAVCAAALLPLIGYSAYWPAVNGHGSYSRGSKGRADAKVLKETYQ